MAGTLYLVATPIGNLEDITHRALRVLGEVDVIACEDTRHTRTLLNHYRIRTKTVSYHEHNEAKSTPKLVARLAEGESFALISDAGTPLLSDPGARLVRAAVDAGVAVSAVPGASAQRGTVGASNRGSVRRCLPSPGIAAPTSNSKSQSRRGRSRHSRSRRRQKFGGCVAWSKGPG